MNYTTLSIRKGNHIGKYIFFYADYLQEAWLSEVNENGSTTIIRQFKCKSTSDLEALIAKLSKMGEIMNLASNETVEQHLAVLQMKLEKSSAVHFLDGLTFNFNHWFRTIRMYCALKWTKPVYHNIPSSAKLK